MRKLIEWSLDNPLIVILLGVAMAAFGVYAFKTVNVEAYPDPAPAIIEVVAQFPGAPAEQVETQVTIPLETVLSGMPGLTYMRSKSLFGLAHLRNQFDYGVDYEKAKQEVINRLQLAQLPANVVPQISPASPTGEIYRYTLQNPKDEKGNPLYTLSDLKALNDWTLMRELLRVPRIAGVTSAGGTVKRYEVRPDPDRLLRYNVTLPQLQNALASSTTNVGGEYVVQGHTVQVVRGLGLIGGGRDPLVQVGGLKDPKQAAGVLRDEERRRLREIRQIVLTSTNNVPVRIDDVVEGGSCRHDDDLGREGVVVAHQTRLGRVSISEPRKDDEGYPLRDADGQPIWDDEDDVVQGIVLLRKGQESLKALEAVEAKIKELNETPGRLLPGVKIAPYYDRTELIGITTETVRENLFMGVALVSVILFMFLSNVRTALIVAINIPLALLFAFSVLWLRGRSANLLSIGAVDFGIIVDSSVIMVENIFRHLSTGENANLSLRDRMLKAAGEVMRSLFFATIIMVCALLPLFTMKGPEGQIFGPMADTYAFALAGALLFTFTLSPVLCLVFFKNLKPARDNFLVRWLKGFYLWQLDRILEHRWLALACFGVLIAGTLISTSTLGQEFMPELEEGNLWIRGTFPVNVSLDRVAENARLVRHILRSYPEVETVVPQIGRPDDGTDPTGFYNMEVFVPLKPEKDWPVDPKLKRPPTKVEMVEMMNEELNRSIPGVDWNFSQNIRDNVMEARSGVKGENSIKVFGPDLEKLEQIADRVKTALSDVRGVFDAGVFRIKGQSNLEFPIDRDKCSTWNVSVGDVQNVIETAVGGKAWAQVIEGERTFDVAIRWPESLRRNEQAILNIPVDLIGHVVTPGLTASTGPTPMSGPSTGLATNGKSQMPPSLVGSQNHSPLSELGGTPRLKLRDLVTPLDDRGRPSPSAQFVRPGASTIYREQSNRFIAIKFGVHGRDLASTVAEAKAKIEPIIKAPYRAVWSGEFQEMEEANVRMIVVVSISLVLIFLLIYLAFHSFLDALVVLALVAAMSLGGIWALLLTGVNFNISAAVGFVSVLGVAVMEGMLMVSGFNQARAQGAEVRESVRTGMEKRLRPVVMTALTATLGLLPAALSTRIGAQSQRPLAIVVVGGMLMMLLLINLVPLLYSYYGHREPKEGADSMAH